MGKLASISDIFTHLPLATQLSLAFVLAIAVIFHLTFRERTADFGPTILTTTGIFFTFLGIAIGLLEFDVDKLQESIPKLLVGLKTAFWASVAGVGGALTLKFRYFAFGAPIKSGAQSRDGATIEDLIESMNSVQKSLSGDGDGTVVSQLKLMRQDSNDRLDSLQKAQTEALKKLSEMGSAALVEALRDVIRDFNTRLTEQFGENFKHLNEGVAKLLVWQNQHREHVETMNTRLTDILTIAKSTVDSLAQTVEKAARFSAIASDLAILLNGLESQKAQINSYAEALGQLLNSAKDSIPQLQQTIIDIARQLSDASLQNQKILTGFIENSTKSISGTIESTSQAMKQATEEHSAAMSRALDAAAQASKKAAEDQGNQISKLVAKSKEQIDVLDAALSDELKKSLEALGGHLAALSEKFVSDYGPLTDRLREIVRIAGAIK